MTEWAAGVASALWLGILTSISPCPLASNVAAVSYVGRHAVDPRRAVLAGLAYAAGRAATYVAVAWIVVASLLSIPDVALFLQKRMNQVLGPLLVLIGAGMLGWIPARLPSTGFAEGLRTRVASRGAWGAAGLGVLFALSFCPVSAGLFFGALIPLATSARSTVLLPAVYGLGTGMPVVAFALLLALGTRGVARAFDAMTRFERVARVATGVIFVLAGGYLVLVHLLGVEF